MLPQANTATGDTLLVGAVFALFAALGAALLEGLVSERPVHDADGAGRGVISASGIGGQ